MVSLKGRYLRLCEKAAGRAIDYSKATIYTFPKFCKRCGQGLKKPSQWDRRTIKALFKGAYCSDKCKEAGPVYHGIFFKTKASSDEGYKGDYPLEELAFLAVQMKREEEAMSPMKRLVHQARENFRLLSERLSWLESETGDKWYAEKYRYWITKAK